MKWTAVLSALALCFLITEATETTKEAAVETEKEAEDVSATLSDISDEIDRIEKLFSGKSDVSAAEDSVARPRWIDSRIPLAQCDPKDAQSSWGVDEPGEEPSFWNPQTPSYTDTPPESISWPERGYIGVARDQLSCGSCWSFPFVNLLSSTYKMYTGEMPLMGIQHIVDCALDHNGCGAGTNMDGYKFVAETQFMPYEKDEPYTAYYQKCTKTQADYANETRNAMAKMWLTSFRNLGQSAEYIEKALLNGPITSGGFLTSGDMTSYPVSATTSKKGDSESIMTDESCYRGGSHIITIVGYTPEYWLLQNSYGTTSYKTSTVTNCYDGTGEYHLQKGFHKYSRPGTECNLLKNCRQFLMTYRRELQYALGSSNRKTVYDAMAYCEAMNKEGETGWTLAVIPTKMHMEQVLKMIQEAYVGYDSNGELNAAKTKIGKKADFNNIWVGLKRTEGTMEFEWMDDFTPYQYGNWKYGFWGSDVSGLWVQMSKHGDGDWSVTDPVKKRSFVCSRPATCWNFDTAIRHATVKFSGDRTEGTTATVTCGDGYELVGQATLTCAAGKWGVYPSCLSAEEKKSRCMPPAVEKMNLEPSLSTYMSGRKVSVSCEAGYTLNGPSVITCNSGSWQALPKCE